MKNILFSTARFPALLIALFLLSGLVSCEKYKFNREVKRFEGEWELTSVVVGGVEAKGTVISSSTLEFEEYDDDKGDFSWQFNYTDGTSERGTGTYEIDHDDDEIEMKNADGTVDVMEYEFDDDELVLSGTVAGETLKIKARKD